MIKFEINGVSVEANEGTSIIEAADRLQIPIPRFCYHQKLSVAANCRMCLVQVENSRKPLPACATPVAPGMKVWTTSKEALAAQRSVMEFLLINHPLDCPICDQGGECELQDVAINYGQDFSRYTEAKRTVLDHDLGSLVATDMTRCIQCTRCVRFGTEVSGEPELGATGRGELMEIGTFIEKHINSEVSGNIIDLCPVGALTSKPFRFRARAWELQQYASVAPHDCLGANVYLHVYNDKVMRVVPRENEQLNEVWLSDRDRFAYTGILHEDRLRKPMIRRNDKWQVVSWIEALQFCIAGIRESLDTHGADQFGVLVSPNATLEEQYLLQKFARQLGINNIDHRLRQLDFRDQASAPLYPQLGIKFADLATQDRVLMVGSHLSKEQPNAALRLRQAALRGAQISVLNPVDYDFNFAITTKLISAEIIGKLTAILDQLQGRTNGDAAAAAIAQSLQSGERKFILLGALALQHSRAAEIKQLAAQIATAVNARCGWLSDGSNAVGAWLSGCIPHRGANGTPVAKPGKNTAQMLESDLRAFILYGIEPSYDSIFGSQALKTLYKADFVIAVNSYQSEELLEIADVILPAANYSEYSGTLINADGDWQNLRAVTKAFAESRPGWQIIQDLARLAGYMQFAYADHAAILAEIRALPAAQLEPAPSNLTVARENVPNLQRIAPISLYAVDGVVRRALPLQATKDAIADPKVQLNSKTARQFGLAERDLAQISASGYGIVLPVEINDHVADKTVVIYQAHKLTNALPACYQAVEIKKC